jgi:threonylcarbamoyladenosine tRNA methylthiotransferase MtaB
VRGRQRSLNHEIIIQTIKELVSDNYKEIILTGVNTAGYRQNEQYGFYELLKDIDHIPGNFRIRISSVEPFQISKEIIDLITNNKKR